MNIQYKQNPFDTDVSNLKQEFTEIATDLPLDPRHFDNIIGDTISKDVLANIEAGKPLSYRQQQQLAEISDESRMYFLLARIASRSLSGESNSDLDLYAMLEGRKPFPTTTIVHGQGGLTYSAIGTICVLLMPNIKSLEQSHSVLQELLHVYEITHRNSLWAIDFSLLQTFPIDLLCTLIGYTIGDGARRITACWLTDRIIPPSFFETIAYRFNCRKIGNHWFPNQIFFDEKS